MSDQKTQSENAGKTAPWYRIFAGDFLAKTGALTPSETGIYIKLLSIMHLHAEPISDDIGRLARRVGADLRTFKPARQALIEAGLIVSRDGFLWSPLSESEMENITRKSKIASENVATRYRKNEQNQCSDSTDVGMLDVRCQIVDTQAPEGPELSPLPETQERHAPPSEEAAREGAAPLTYSPDDEIIIPGIGLGWVVKTVSRRPHALIAEFRLEDGFTDVFLMKQRADRTFAPQPISHEQADKFPALSGETDHGRTA